MTLDDFVKEVQAKMPGYALQVTIHVPTDLPRSYRVLATRSDKSFSLFGKDVNEMRRQLEWVAKKEAEQTA